MEQVSNLIAQELETMVGATDPDPIFSKRKAINALVPYAISLKRDGQEAMVDVISLAATASQSGRFIWHHIVGIQKGE